MAGVMSVPTETQTSIVANKVEMMVCFVSTEEEFHAAQEQAAKFELTLAVMSTL
jgi:hypothetical protein